MADLDPAHVEAVAQVMFDVQGFEDCPAAEAILTSTDPDVHAALLAALVRAGILSDEDEGEPSGYRVMDGRRQTRRRLFTRWEDVDA